MYLNAAISLTRSPTLPHVGPIQRIRTLEALFNGQVAKTVSTGEAVFWEGDTADQIFHVAAGVLRMHRILPDGRRAVMGFLHPGDVVGVSFQDRCLFTAEAVTNVVARRVSRDRFFALVNESSSLRSELFALLCDEMSAAQDQMLLLGRKSAEERVVSFLLTVHRKSGVGGEIELPMSRLDIADYLGLTIETVSRMMTSLCRRGFIAALGRHRVTLCKLGALREIAGDDGTGDTESPRPRRAVWPN